MTLFDILEGELDNWRKLNYNLRALITIATFTGLIFILYNSLRLIHKFIIGKIDFLLLTFDDF